MLLSYDRLFGNYSFLSQRPSGARIVFYGGWFPGFHPGLLSTRPSGAQASFAGA